MCKACGKTYPNMGNARAHIQSVHLKNMDRKIDLAYFEQNPDVIVDRKVEDPEYPSDEYVTEFIKSACQ